MLAALMMCSGCPDVCENTVGIVFARLKSAQLSQQIYEHSTLQDVIRWGS